MQEYSLSYYLHRRSEIPLTGNGVACHIIDMRRQQEITHYKSHKPLRFRIVQGLHSLLGESLSITSSNNQQRFPLRGNGERVLFITAAACGTNANKILQPPHIIKTTYTSIPR